MQTPHEPWTHQAGMNPVYDAALMWIGGSALIGPVLDIGSPPFIVETLRASGLVVDQLDVRSGPTVTHQADATAMPFPDALFQAVTSTCVLCHVGLGRYGDAMVPDGPARMLAEIRRVLRPGGVCLLQVGPVCSGPTYQDEDWQRVLEWGSLPGLFVTAGLHVTDHQIWREEIGRASCRERV